MGNNDKIDFPKLKGGKNYIVWALRMKSYLVREKLFKAINEEDFPKSEEALALIRLKVEDGPLCKLSI